MVGIDLTTAGVPQAHADTQLSPVKVGARTGATRVPFTISDEVSASVDVGSGNLMVTTADRMLPTVNRGMVSFGLSYNSLALTSGSAYSSGVAGHGWFLPSSQDARVTENADGSVFFWAPDGQQGLFQPATGGGFTSPANMNKSLTQLANGDYQVTDRNGQSTTFTYNASGDQVATAATATGNRAAFGWTDGKLTSITTVVGSPFVSVDNEISSSGYAYEAGRRAKDGNGGGTLTWNSAGQMSKQVNGSDTDTFMYAGSGQDELIQQTLNGSTTNYTYGRTNQAGVSTAEQYTQGGTTATYDNDVAGQPIDFTQGGTDYFLVYNGIGRFIATMLPTGQQNGGNLAYDPYGAFQQATDGSSSAQTKAEREQVNGVNPMTGTEMEAAAAGGESPWTTLGIGDQLVALAGWWKRGARWNDTTTGTWTTVGPLTVLNDPGRANPYAYAGDDPVNAMDPAGRWDVSIEGAAEAFAGALAIVGGSELAAAGVEALGLFPVGTVVGVFLISAGVSTAGLGVYLIKESVA